jgi:hypothetical protein
LGILLCILGGIGIKVELDKMYAASTQSPIRTLRVVIGQSQDEELIVQLLRFSYKHGFLGFNYGDRFDGGATFLVEMKGGPGNISIDAVAVSSAPNQVRISLYNFDTARPTPNQTVDELFKDLQNYIYQIPGATFSVEQ